MPVLNSRLILRLCLVAIGFSSAMGLGCVLLVEDTQCGAYAYDYRGACYCEDGFDGDDPAGAGCSPLMSFRVTDDCDDGQDVYWKLFSDTRDWTWPAGDAEYRTPGLGADGFETILCEDDETICFGALSDSGLEYGVGLDFLADCDDCCYPCEAREVDLGYLTCN